MAIFFSKNYKIFLAARRLKAPPPNPHLMKKRLVVPVCSAVRLISDIFEQIYTYFNFGSKPVTAATSCPHRKSKPCSAQPVCDANHATLYRHRRLREGFSYSMH